MRDSYNGDREVRIAFLFASLATYFLSCLKELKRTADVKLFVVHWPDMPDAPFAIKDLDWIDTVYLKESISESALVERLEAFQPHALFIPGWLDKSYLRIARRMRSKTLTIAGVDTQWSGTIKQRLGARVIGGYLRSAIDILWVAGERQRVLAAELGYSTESCWTGLYSCDRSFFSNGGRKPMASREKAFLFVGRYAKEKGIDVLARAYHAYRLQNEAPWKLVCVGTGEYSPDLWTTEGIEHLGFISPEDLPGVMSRYRAFVLPSIREPWGLVIHEAASSGMPIICTHACGAGVHLVYDYVNGLVIDAASTDQLVLALHKISSLQDRDLDKMSQSSFELSSLYTPERWVQTLLSNVKRRASAKELWIN